MTKFFRKLYLILLIILPASLFFSYYPIISLGHDSTMNFEFSVPLICLILFDMVAFINMFIIFFQEKQRLKPRQKSQKTTAKASASTHAATCNAGTSSNSTSVNSTCNAGTSSISAVKTHAKAKIDSKSGLPGHHFPGITDRQIFLLSLFPFYATLSIFWSENPLRAILTSGIIWLLYFAVFAILFLTPLLQLERFLPAKHKYATKNANLSSVQPQIGALTQIILKVFIGTAAFVCAFCWLQAVLDVIGLSREDTLLCRGCTYYSFGFPHPSGFAIEPQFMGNLLLAPTLLMLYLLIFQPKSSPKNQPENHSKTRPQNLLVYLLAGFFSATLFFTFSRGAIYAYAVALIVMFILSLAKRCFKPSLIIIPVVTFVLTLGIQGIFAAVSPTSDTFISGTTKAVHQLTLGIIDLRPQDDTSAAEEVSPEQVGNDKTDDNASVFGGYVAESTNIRLLLNQLAMKIWRQSPQNLLIGVGLGGAGVAINRHYPELFPWAKEIVQNEFFSLLLELGIIGIILVIISIYYVSCNKTVRRKVWPQPVWCLLLPLVVAYLITLNFFSGLPNALHIYLLPAVFCLSLQSKTLAKK